MITFFRSNPLWGLIITPVIAISVWLYAWFHNFTVVVNGLPLYESAISLIGKQNTAAFAFIGFALVLSQAIHFNFILNQSEVLYKNTWLPAIFYVLFMSIIPQFVVFNPMLLVNSIFIFVLQKIFKLYKNTDTFSLDFEICMLISLASLFYIPALMFLMLYFIALIILKSFAWRDWIIAFLGLLFPYFFLFLFFFLTDQYAYISVKYFTTTIQQSFDFLKIFPQFFIISVSVMALLLFLSLLKVSQNFYKNVIRTRNYQQVMLFCLIVTALIVILDQDLSIYRFSVLAIPLSVFVTYFFVAAKRPLWFETLFILLIANLFFNYYVISIQNL